MSFAKTGPSASERKLSSASVIETCARFRALVVIVVILVACGTAGYLDARVTDLMMSDATARAIEQVPVVIWEAMLGMLALQVLAWLVVAKSARRPTNREDGWRERQAHHPARPEAVPTAHHVESELLSAVSHELRDPLALIHGYAELLFARASVFDSEQVSHIAGEINRGSMLMTRIVDDLLDFNRLERGSLRLKPRETDLVEVARETLETFVQKRGFERLSMEAPRPVIVWGDPQRLGQVASNLISNALRYAPTGPIRIRVDWESDGRAVLEVKDSGPGISSAALPHLWDMFYRAPEAIESQVTGTGIGLALVKRLIEAHGGTVEAESKPRRGATFRIYLPARERGDATLPSGPEATVGAGNSELAQTRLAEWIAAKRKSGPVDVLEEASAHLASLP